MKIDYFQIMFYLFNRVGLKEKSIFAGNLAIMLKSGLTITEALDISREQASGRLKETIREIARMVVAGNSLAKSMKQYPDIFPGFFTSAVAAGEASGNLENNLHHLAEQLKREKELADKIKSAMFYPVIVLVLGAVLGLSLAFFVLPKITPLFTGLNIKLPLTTRALIAVSNLVQAHGYVLLGALVAAVIVISWLVRQRFVRPLTHYLFLRLPLIKGLSMRKNLAQICLTLGTLLKSGLSIDEALIITGNAAGNYYYGRCLAHVRADVSEGGKLSDGLEEFRAYFPQMAVSMIRVGEKSGRLEEELLDLARIYDAEAQNVTGTMATAIEPALLIVIGLVVGGLALAIITPIYQLSGGMY